MAETICPRDYYQASHTLIEVGHALAKVHTEAMEKLADTGEMAGTDDAGDEFAKAYDEQTQAFNEIGRNLGPAIHKYGAILRQMGKNHAEAEGNSNIQGPQDSAPPPDPGPPPTVSSSAPPTAAGGEGEGLSEAIGLLQKIGIPVPNGNTGKLDTAAAAWAKIAKDSGGSYKGKLAGAAATLSELNGEEIDVIVEDLEELDS